jgi:hypothetical protein
VWIVAAPARVAAIIAPARALQQWEQSEMKAVSEMLGHGLVGVTLDLRSHVTPAAQREATAAMDATISPR